MLEFNYIYRTRITYVLGDAYISVTMILCEFLYRRLFR